MDKDIKVSLKEVNPLVLAYMGDAYIELLAREYVIGDGNCKVASLNKTILRFVTAKSQSEAAKKIADFLNDKEKSVFRAGENSKPKSLPKSATPAEYMRATAFECLFGFLYFTNECERAKELFKIGYSL